LIINFGLLLVAIGIHAFKNPNKFALGGVSGLSIVLAYFFPNITIGNLLLALNIAVIVIGFLFLGFKGAIKSAYGAIALSGMVLVLEFIFPIAAPLTDQKFLELVYGVFLPGIGSGIVFSYGATTGGTDILAKILSKYYHARVSVMLLIVDFMIAASAGFFYGVEICLYSMLGVCLKTFVLDSLMESLQIYKIVVIVSEKSDEVKNYIVETLQRGATVHLAKGAFTIEEKEVITTVLNRRQAKRLQLFVKKTDAHAFVTISNSSRIIGNGFGGFE
jgi:uncharacterized membrane-anchored protein YitT (DUF2179 family)